ncbi:hypothetical protein CEUSTIGMA_g5732.t1 [Chlamydomonas eustigma]|uniref:Tubulin-tyrosine ligase family protein n=1 Tax=Chlamydomonas eustigma TaxID=1157962 RepID=A0A250X690_9CHLO|nr:hypothetical protein CEUSTIGMA_g5732.t1 [Chlamydomonas eustigma]|eukprot:GAX78290.1 hypothetical protein CEUSTIGMA_g5732.t1 [Chlamydomonas eustigma]
MEHFDEFFENENDEVYGEEEEDLGKRLREVPTQFKEPTEHELQVADVGKKRKKKKKAPPPIRINLSNCKYEVLRIVQRKLGWKEVGDDEDWEIYWTDTSVSMERVLKLTKIQKINHFNGMLELCRKRNMARNLQKIQKMFPEHYDFFPKTFTLPTDLQELLNDMKSKGKKQIYILKPDAGCQGKGIRLIQGGKEESIQKVLKEMDTPNIVAQHYLPKPHLINGFKYDMRIYTLVLCVDPLRVFIYKEGLARICTEKYVAPKASNLEISYMHLTNYAVNKHNENFVANKGGISVAEDASKLGLKQLEEHIRAEGYDWTSVWQAIQQLIIKSLISVQPLLKNNYRSVMPIDNDGFSCFEILGYDVMLDSELRPWLIEVNHSPSFNIDSPLDLAIKEELVQDTIQLARIDPNIISKIKKAERKASTGRLLDPLLKKKQEEAEGPTAAGPGSASVGPTAPGAAAAAPPASAAASTAVTINSTATPSSATMATTSTLIKPNLTKMMEEIEIQRAEVLRQREKYEACNMGGYTRIFPSDDPKLQVLYEELLAGAAEIFCNAFASKAKKALEAISEERRKKEEQESESVKAERAKAKAHRDRLAQMAVDRRRIKAQLVESQQLQLQLQLAQYQAHQRYTGPDFGVDWQESMPVGQYTLSQQQNSGEADAYPVEGYLHVEAESSGSNSRLGSRPSSSHIMQLAADIYSRYSLRPAVVEPAPFATDIQQGEASESHSGRLLVSPSGSRSAGPVLHTPGGTSAKNGTYKQNNIIESMGPSGPEPFLACRPHSACSSAVAETSSQDGFCTAAAASAADEWGASGPSQAQHRTAQYQRVWGWGGDDAPVPALQCQTGSEDSAAAVSAADGAAVGSTHTAVQVPVASPASITTAGAAAPQALNPLNIISVSSGVSSTKSVQFAQQGTAAHAAARFQYATDTDTVRGATPPLSTSAKLHSRPSSSAARPASAGGTNSLRNKLQPGEFAAAATVSSWQGAAAATAAAIKAAASAAASTSTQSSAAKAGFYSAATAGAGGGARGAAGILTAAASSTAEQRPSPNAVKAALYDHTLLGPLHTYVHGLQLLGMSAGRHMSGSGCQSAPQETAASLTSLTAFQNMLSRTRPLSAGSGGRPSAAAAAAAGQAAPAGKTVCSIKNFPAMEPHTSATAASGGGSTASFGSLSEAAYIFSQFPAGQEHPISNHGAHVVQRVQSATGPSPPAAASGITGHSIPIRRASASVHHHPHSASGVSRTALPPRSGSPSTSSALAAALSSQQGSNSFKAVPGSPNMSTTHDATAPNSHLLLLSKPALMASRSFYTMSDSTVGVNSRRSGSGYSAHDAVHSAAGGGRPGTSRGSTAPAAAGAAAPPSIRHKSAAAMQPDYMWPRLSTSSGSADSAGVVRKTSGMRAQHYLSGVGSTSTAAVAAAAFCGPFVVLEGEAVVPYRTPSAPALSVLGKKVQQTG